MRISNKRFAQIIGKIGHHYYAFKSILKHPIDRHTRHAYFSRKLSKLKMYASPDSRRAADYKLWVERYDQALPGEHERARSYIETLANKPKISILVPLYNTTAESFSEMINSVKDQFYENWELCLADDASPAPHVKPMIDRVAHEDPRIKVILRTSNGNISAASNTALTLATGEFIALLDHDDVLAPHALAMVADAINKNPTADLFYSDEDQLDSRGRRNTPYFKPDWNEELFYSQNYVNHLGVYRTKLVKALGGFRIGFEGSQDWDLALRVVAESTATPVHIPHVLYHWRIHVGATTFSSTKLEQATGAARNAVQEHLERKGLQVRVVEHNRLYNRVVRPQRGDLPKVSVVIPTRDCAEILENCINGLLGSTDYHNIEILIADNGSVEQRTKELFKYLKLQGVQVVDCAGEFNYSQINNRVAGHAVGEFLLFLNNDIEIFEPQWLKEMMSFFQEETVGAVGAKLYYPDGSLQHGGVVLGIGGLADHIYRFAPPYEGGYFGQLELAREASCVTAACMVVRKSIFDEIGGFEEQLKVTFNDVDLCIRIRNEGFRIIWTPFAQLIHHESKSRGDDDTKEKKMRFASECNFLKERWKDALQVDPFWNPNLSTKSLYCDLAFPPRVSRPWL